MPSPFGCFHRGLVALTLASSLPPAIATEHERAVIAELIEYVDHSARALGGCPTALVVRRGGVVLLERHRAGVNDEAPLGPVDEATLWPLFSITKSYAAALLLNLEHDRMLSLDDPVSKHVPEFRTAGAGPFDRRDVTVRHLASHISGIEFPEEAWNASPRDLATVRVVTKPGEVFNYTAQGMHVLERTVEAATGREFAVLLRERILDPMGLVGTRYCYTIEPGIPMLPKQRIGPAGPVPDAYSLASDGVHPHYGLYATAREANRFADVWLGHGVLAGRRYWTADRQAEVWKHHSTRPSDTGRYGLLWWLFENEPGYVMSGAGAKVTAVSPETGVAITVLRIPLEPATGSFDFYQDKIVLVRFAKRLGASAR